MDKTASFIDMRLQQCAEEMGEGERDRHKGGPFRDVIWQNEGKHHREEISLDHFLLVH